MGWGVGHSWALPHCINDRDRQRVCVRRETNQRGWLILAPQKSGPIFARHPVEGLFGACNQTSRYIRHDVGNQGFVQAFRDGPEALANMPLNLVFAAQSKHQGSTVPILLVTAGVTPDAPGAHGSTAQSDGSRPWGIRSGKWFPHWLRGDVLTGSSHVHAKPWCHELTHSDCLGINGVKQ